LSSFGLVSFWLFLIGDLKSEKRFVGILYPLQEWILDKVIEVPQGLGAVEDLKIKDRVQFKINWINENTNWGLYKIFVCEFCLRHWVSLAVSMWFATICIKHAVIYYFIAFFINRKFKL
jgi:hypothetical protein